MEQRKKCFKCGGIKNLTAFYKHKGTYDGRLGKCKSCSKIDSKDRIIEMSKKPEWVEKEKERGRLKYHNLGYKSKYKPSYEQKKKAMDNYRDKYPEKAIVKSRMNKIKPKVKGNHLHHWSYNEVHITDVIELSIVDHYTAHRYMKYDQERRMYRAVISTESIIKGSLLDNKELHTSYLEHLDIKVFK